MAVKKGNHNREDGKGQKRGTTTTTERMKKDNG